MANKNDYNPEDLDYLNYIFDLWSNFQVYVNNNNILKHWSVDQYEDFIKMYNKVYDEMERLKVDIPMAFERDTKQRLHEYLTLILEYIATLRHRAISFRAKAQGNARYGLLADRQYRKANLQTIMKIDKIGWGLCKYRDELAEWLKYVDTLMSACSFITREDATDFIEILKTYSVSGKDEALKEFRKFVKRLVARDDDLYYCGLKISFFIGVLNSNGVIDKSETEKMRNDYAKAIRKLILKNRKPEQN